MNKIVLISTFLLIYQNICAQPVPSDVYREYRWFYEKGDAGQAMRVGSRETTAFPTEGMMNWPFDIDLKDAVKAEIIAEKVLCHDGTTGLAIQVNDSCWYYFPQADAIPEPKSMYQHHTYPVLRMPLSVFKSGKGNRFRLKVDPEHPWNWPQNLINGLHVRIYYDPEVRDHVKGMIYSINDGDKLCDNVNLSIESDAIDKIEQVDYVGLYKDVNLEGDGIYRQWHYIYDHSRLMGHIGSSIDKPFIYQWDTTWLPDQSEPMQVCARITDINGITFQSKPVKGLTLGRKNSVELCKPYNIPQKWVTRSGEHSEYFDITGDVKKIKAARLVWCSWSPGYMTGISINNKKIFDAEGPKYATYHHNVEIKDLSCFKPGQNILTTARTPLINGQMVHGMEVNYPGIMVLIKYDN